MHTDHEMDYQRRFGGIARLYGEAALDRFANAHICVVGVGGVGSWVVEGLARSAIGKLTLIDLDNVAESNINRQIQALSSTLGMAKIDALAKRIADINPLCKVTLIEDFLSAENLSEMIPAQGFDYVIDAIDETKTKVALIAHCRQQQIPLLTIGAAGGQTDPGKIEIRDLSRTEQEPLLALVRKRLRQKHGFPRGTKSKFGIDAVFSSEALTTPDAAANCALPGTEDDEANPATTALSGINCAGFGSSVVVTASFGLRAAAHVLNQLKQQAQQSAVTVAEKV